MILPPRPPHALSGLYARAVSRPVRPLRPHVEAAPVILPPPLDECDDDGAAQTLCTQLDHETEVTP